MRLPSHSRQERQGSSGGKPVSLLLAHALSSTLQILQPRKLCSLHFLIIKMDIDDEEAPPLLVDVEGNDDEEPKPIKVPITIVTGKYKPSLLRENF
jgi:hypothetical protein